MPLLQPDHEDFARFARAPSGVSLAEWLSLEDEAIREALVAAGDAQRARQARLIAFYVGAALMGGFPQLAEEFEPGSAEEAGNFDALNRALGVTRV